MFAGVFGLGVGMAIGYGLTATRTPSIPHPGPHTADEVAAELRSKWTIGRTG